MKKLTILSMLLSAPAWASGSLGISQEILGTRAVQEPTVSLYIYERLDSNNETFYQSWTGFKPNHWLLSDHSYNVHVNKKLSFGLGPSLHREAGQTHLMIKVNAQYRLW